MMEAEMNNYYTVSHKMSDLATNNYRILLVLNRFGIGLGFGEKNIAEVCKENKVNVDTFLAVVNMLLGKTGRKEPEYASISPVALIDYLYRSHEYFLNYRLPGIRRDMLHVLDTSQHQLNKAVLRYFDEYVDEVRKHMNYEEKKVFPYVRALINGKNRGKYSITIFRKHHDQVEAKLKELKQILIKYYPASASDELNSVLFDIFNCEYDLASHNEIEDKLLIPVILNLEHEKLSQDEQAG